MLCPSCAAESAADSHFCTHCGFNLGPAADQYTLGPAISSLPPKRNLLRFIGIVFRILLTVAYAAFITLIQYRLQFSSEAFGYWLGTMLVPFLAAYAIAGAKKRRNGRAFSYWALGILVVLGSASLAGNRKRLTDLATPDMLRTMAGTKPLANDASDDDKQTVAVTKLIFADMRDINTSYEQKQAILRPDLARLYTYSSFSSRQSLEQMASVVNQKLALDRDASAKIEHIPDIVRKHLASSTLSESEKQEFLKGFESKFGTSEVILARKGMMAAETDWANSTSDLYKFSLDHRSKIVVTKSSIGITDPSVRTQFNAKLTQAKKLRDNFNAATGKVTAARDALMKSQGVTPADMGLTK